MKLHRIVLAAALCLFPVLSHAQETRGTIAGRVTDSSGARVVGASVTVTNTGTGVSAVVKSNGAGEYTAPFLQPGHYSLSVTSKGFATFTHTDLELQTQQILSENVTLAPGSVDQVVTVAGGTPLIDTADASMGQTLTAEEVEELPSNGRSPLGFAHLEYGAVAKGKHAESQTTPFGNSTASDFSLGGGASASNELLLNGVPNMQNSSRVSAYSPELDSVDAVHIDLFSANAALGDSSGGTVNITTKSGTNHFHGTVSEYYAGSRPLTAKPYFTPAGESTSSTHFNQYGATIGGPVAIPHLFNGRDKLFFFYAFEGYNGSSPATAITTVPTAAERQGDFSSLLALGSNITVARCKGVTSTYNSYQLFNPYSGVADPQCPGQTLRSPIPGNVLANAGLTVSPIAQAYLKLVPLPNFNGASTKPNGENNYFASDPTTNKYTSHEGRLDYNMTAADHFSFEAHESLYTNTQSNIFFNPLTGTTSTVVLWGGFLENVHTFSPSTSLDFRLGLSRSVNTSAPNSLGINPTSYGYPGYLASNSTALGLPGLSFSDNGAPIPNLSGNPGGQARFDGIQLFAAFEKTIGHHTIKIGPDIRANKDSTLSPGAANGGFSFSAGSGGIVAQGSTTASPSFGGAYALFDMGVPTGGSQSIATPFQYNNWYFAGFAQDDWRAASTLTLSLGIRLEHETPIVESNNRMVVGWDPTAVNAVSGPAAAAYAKSPNSLLPVSSFSALGGVTYATPNQRSSYSTAPIYASPRVGFAWAPAFAHGTLAIRGGIAVYLNPFNDYNFGQAYGYSASTSYVGSNLSTQVPTSTLADPFNPNVNPIIQPVGSSLGIDTNLGNQIVYINPHPKVPYVEKSTLDIQKQFGHSWMIEIGGFTAHSVHLSYQNQVSAAPLLPLLSHSQTYDPAVTAQLSANTANPFYGLLPPGDATTGLNKTKTLAVHQLLQAHPQFTNVYEQLVPGANEDFNSLNARIQKQMSRGLQFNLNYEYSRALGAQNQLNPGGPLWYGETTSDFPNHIAATVIYQLPFGRGRTFLNHSRLLDELIGGYEVTGIYQYLSGTPLQWGNVIYNGNFKDFKNQPHDASGAPSFNVAGFDSVVTDPKAAANAPNGYNFRTFPQYLLRSDPNNNVDLSVLKNFTLGDRFVLQPRVDAFNAFNHVQFQGANTNPTSSSFGVVNKQLNSSRDLQGGLHILF